MIAIKKIKENYLLYSFNTQMSEFLLSLLMDKNSLYTHNQLYAIASSDIQHCQIRYISLLDLYKLEKEFLKVKL